MFEPLLVLPIASVRLERRSYHECRLAPRRVLRTRSRRASVPRYSEAPHSRSPIGDGLDREPATLDGPLFRWALRAALTYTRTLTESCTQEASVAVALSARSGSVDPRPPGLVAHQTPVVGAVFSHGDHTLCNASVGGQGGLDFAQFDAKPRNLT